MGAKMPSKSALNDALIAVANLAEVKIEKRELFIRLARKSKAKGLRISRIYRKPIKTKQVVLILKKLAANAKALQLEIAELKAPTHNLSNFNLAQRYLELAISDKFPYSIVHFTRSWRYLTIPEMTKTLSKFEQITTDAISLIQKDTKKGRSLGTVGFPGFDEFAQGLFNAAKAAGGELGISKMSGKGQRKGSFLKAVELLRPYFPQTFFPATDSLGRILERIIKHQ
jgi:hypothetical protein